MPIKGDGFVIWTRLAPSPLEPDGLGGMPSRSYEVLFTDFLPALRALVLYGDRLPWVDRRKLVQRVGLQGKLILAFIRVGLVPDSGALWFLAKMVGAARALDRRAAPPLRGWRSPYSAHTAPHRPWLS